MGIRKVSTRVRDVDDLRDAAERRPATTDGRAGNVHDHLLDLQQSHGNTAVAGVVQRRERAASTDAPGARKKQPPKKEAAPTSYAPTEANPKFSSWATPDLSARAAQESQSTVKNSLYFAAELYEEYWFRTKDRGVAMNLYRVYKQLGDGPRTEFWLGVANGSIKPGQPASEDMSDKEF